MHFRRPSSSRGTFHAPVELVSWSSLAGKDYGSYLRRHGVPDPVSTSVEELVEEVNANVEEDVHDVDADEGAVASFVLGKGQDFSCNWEGRHDSQRGLSSFL